MIPTDEIEAIRQRHWLPSPACDHWLCPSENHVEDCHSLLSEREELLGLALDLAEALDELTDALHDSDRREMAGDPLGFHSNMLGATRRQADAILARARAAGLLGDSQP